MSSINFNPFAATLCRPLCRKPLARIFHKATGCKAGALINTPLRIWLACPPARQRLGVRLSFCRFLVRRPFPRCSVLCVPKKSGRRTAALQDAGPLADALNAYPLQRSVLRCHGTGNRFNGFSHVVETVETVSVALRTS